MFVCVCMCAMMGTYMHAHVCATVLTCDVVMCVHVYQEGYVCAHTCLCNCPYQCGRQRLSLGVFPCSGSIFFWDSIFHWTWRSPFKLTGWSISRSQSWGYGHMCHSSRLCYGLWGLNPEPHAWAESTFPKKSHLPGLELNYPGEKNRWGIRLDRPAVSTTLRHFDQVC